ncbi:MAG: DUF87 domain-containing protein [Candidatus Lokiarchaeota archaeon]|nr:DUF87 domain-containing protein [Candidatus Lokiarchaeota archaeon]
MQPLKWQDFTKDAIAQKISRNQIQKIWFFCFIISCVYFIIGYLLPLVVEDFMFILPGKNLIEYGIYSIPVIISTLYAYLTISEEDIIHKIDGPYQTIQVGNSFVLTQCFEIQTVSSNLESTIEPTSKYETSMLLALRAGMDQNVSMAYETGVFQGTPFIRLAISVVGKNIDELKQFLRREAIRSEAIIISSIEGASLRLLENIELDDALSQFTNTENAIIDEPELIKTSMISIKGNPKINPTLQSTQIDKFLSTALKQQYSVCLTTVFSRAESGKEKKKLESKYKKIRTKEKEKEDSLTDYAEKQRILKQYEKVQNDSGWFDTSTYILFRESLDKIDSLQQAVKGIVLSIWGGTNEIELSEKNIGTKTKIQLQSRRHIKKYKLHVTELAAFVNLPIQPLPVISSIPKPTFSVPSKESVDNELVIGKMIFEDKPIGSVGLKENWLREHLAVLGATGTGKTTLVRKLIHEISTKTNIPWWIFDVKGSEYADLAKEDPNGVVIRPGLDETFTLHLLNPRSKDIQQESHTTFLILRELLRERNSSSELSPAMERVLRESIIELAEKENLAKSVENLVEIIKKNATDNRTGDLTKDALLNRLEILLRDPLGTILSGGKGAIDIENLLDRRVVFDLRYVSRKGGMDAARLLYNLVAKKIFDVSMKRGITPKVHHIVVLEEASNLVPESYTRSSAADVTTGESMVLLQRATGQGVIVVSTRPNISSNILANTATKITFRLPYDSSIGGRFLALEELQEKYLRTMQRGRAIAIFPGTEAFEIATEKPSDMISIFDQDTESKDQIRIETHHYESSVQDKEESTSIYDRFGNIANHIVAFLASNKMATEEGIIGHIESLEMNISKEDVREIIWELISLGTIQRESISLVGGGFIFCLPNCGKDSVKQVIVDYIVSKLTEIDEEIDYQTMNGNPTLVVNKTGIAIFPEHIKASELNQIMENISEILNNHTSYHSLIVIVRGSVAAAELRELIENSESHEDVSVIPAFPSSIDQMLKTHVQESRPATVTKKASKSQYIPSKDSQIIAPERAETKNKRTQLKIWKDLVLKFVKISDGSIEWNNLLEFIETTAIQSHNKRSIPLDIEMGTKCLKELLADEELIAIRIGEYTTINGYSPGLWVLGANQIMKIKEHVIQDIQKHLLKKSNKIGLAHESYDICDGTTSYIILPSQKQLSEISNCEKEVKCEVCGATKIICIVAASEYIDERLLKKENIQIRTIEEGITILT